MTRILLVEDDLSLAMGLEDDLKLEGYQVQVARDGETASRLALAEPDQLTTCVYNVRGFSSKAAEIRSEVLKHYPDAEIVFEPDPVRQALVDSWPGDVDASLAQKDWGFCPKHGLSKAMADYLVPAMKKRYAATANR